MKHSRTYRPCGKRLVALVVPTLLIFTFLIIICFTGPLTAAAQQSSRVPHTAGNQSQQVLKNYTEKQYLEDWNKELKDYNEWSWARDHASQLGTLPGPFGMPLQASPTGLVPGPYRGN